MKSLTINRSLIAGAAITLMSVIGVAALPASNVLAASNVEEEAAIYAKNVTEGTAYSNAGTTAKDGEVVSFEIYYHDLESPDSGMNAINVNIEASLPSGYTTDHTVSTVVKAENSNEIDDSTSVTTSDATELQFIPGSVTWKHDTGTNAAPNWVTQTIGDGLVTSPNGEIVDQNEQPSNNFAATVAFQAKIVPQPAPTPTPAYSCNELDIAAESDRTVKISTFNTTATNGAAFTNAVINWGDNTSKLTTSSVVGQTHQYAASGTYTVSATANFTVNGQNETAGGASCEKQVTFSTTTPPTVTPVTPSTPSTPTPAAPTSLVNTGAGNVVGIFAATTALGAAGFRWITSRRLSRQ
jgi:hypothetical protein